MQGLVLCCVTPLKTFAIESFSTKRIANAAVCDEAKPTYNEESRSVSGFLRFQSLLDKLYVEVFQVDLLIILLFVKLKPLHFTMNIVRYVEGYESHVINTV